MVEEIDRDGAPAAPEVEQAPRYMWTANHTAAKDAIIYRRAIAENPNTVPLRVWQFCEENGLDVCLFDGVSARAVTDLEETLALAPPHAHGQIRSDGGIYAMPSGEDDDNAKFAFYYEQTSSVPVTEDTTTAVHPVEPMIVDRESGPLEQVRGDESSSGHSSGE